MRALAMAFIAIALAQPGSPLNGNWTAAYNGTTYVRLALEDGAAGTQGAMSIGQSIHVDEEGNVDNATPASPTLGRMLHVQWSNQVLSFAVGDGDDADQFELRLVDTNHAELTLIISEDQRQELAAEHIPLPRPFRLTRSR